MGGGGSGPGRTAPTRDRTDRGPKSLKTKRPDKQTRWPPGPISGSVSSMAAQGRVKRMSPRVRGPTQVALWWWDPGRGPKLQEIIAQIRTGMYSEPPGSGTGTLAVRSASMEHYRSVFATTAIMIFGLVAVSPLLRAQDEPRVRPQTNVVMGGAETDIWSDPPQRRVRATSMARDGADRKADLGEGGDAVPRPATFTLLAPETAALFAANDLMPKGDHPRTLQVVRRHRAAKVASRMRPSVAAEAPAPTGAAPVQEMPATPPQKDARIDPIGDLLRGLGIGRNG